MSDPIAPSVTSAATAVTAVSEPLLAGTLPILAVLLASYALGSVSAAYWLAKSRGVDLRQHGSGNLGATNAGRVLGAWAFIAVFIADVSKGVLPVVAALLLVGEQQWQGLAVVGAGVATVLGHVFPCWHGWRGGKAVATSLGVLIALAPVTAVGAAAVFLFGLVAAASGWANLEWRRWPGLDGGGAVSAGLAPDNG